VRSIAASVPRTSSALIVQKPWSQVPVHREIAARLGLADDYGKALLGLSAFAGFDLSVVSEYAAHGFDPEGGIAFFNAGDPATTVAAIGVGDDQRAEQTLRLALDRFAGLDGKAKIEWTTGTTPSGHRLSIGTQSTRRVRATAT